MSDTISVLVVHADLTKGQIWRWRINAGEHLGREAADGLIGLGRQVKAATADIAANVEGSALKELEVGIEITAEGGVSLIGTAKQGPPHLSR